jgi:poly-gamma-glutamate capsule biosynthesis protein CapA/YwtB (metallophosphatase superfamily)
LAAIKCELTDQETEYGEQKQPAVWLNGFKADRRTFLRYLTVAMLSGLGVEAQAQPGGRKGSPDEKASTGAMTLFLCGDVMAGRGIDQIMQRPSDPRIHEPYLKSAADYVQLAERANGPIPRGVSSSYIWGDALDELRVAPPDLRIINLETAVTTSDDYWPDKGIHYRMHPDNTPCLTAAGIDCCVLANNHVLDWGYPGLEETMDVLHRSGLKTAGAGLTSEEAWAPAALEVARKGRVLVFGLGTGSSGVPPEWAAAEKRPGLNLLPDLSDKTLRAVGERVKAVKRPGDVVVVSIHWGGNWGYEVPSLHVKFAHGLIDEAGVDIVHGHSSHHPKGIEVYRGRPIIYGCGDFLNDYEGIAGYEALRGDLVVMYFVTVAPATGRLLRLKMTPMQISRFRLNRPSPKDLLWMRDVLIRESTLFGARVLLLDDKGLELGWR